MQKTSQTRKMQFLIDSGKLKTLILKLQRGKIALDNGLGVANKDFIVDYV